MGQKNSKNEGFGNGTKAPKPGNSTRRLLRRGTPQDESFGPVALGYSQTKNDSHADSRTTGGKPRYGRITYRPLDRARGEFRLLRILPPQKSNHQSDGPAFNPEIVRCQLEYESMDNIESANKEAAKAQLGRELYLDLMFADLPVIEDDPDGRIAAYIKQAMRTDLQKSVDESKSFTMHPRRTEMLQSQFAAFSERRKTWLPDGFNSYTSAHTWESWCKTWIWSPLSGDERHPQKETLGYLALSYVWSDARSLRDISDEAAEAIKGFQSGGRSYFEAARDTGLWAYMNSIEGKGEIMVNGLLFEVSRNLEKALRSLREIPEVQCGQRVWVDSLCIDQSNPAEKNDEVLRMGQIYKNAERVVSWIGDEQDLSGAVLEIMDYVGQSLVTEQDMAQLNQWFISNMLSDFNLGLARLMLRAYWSRIWIMQEVVMGNAKAITICGARCFPTAHLLTFGPRLTSYGSVLHFNADFDLARGREGSQKPVSATELASGVAKLRDLRQLQVNLEVITKNNSPMSTFWFRVASGNFATDPRDTVYGMLNILPKSLVSLLAVEYSAKHTYRDVMIDFAVANFSSNQSLHWMLLRPWSPFPGHPEWPSWVPNLGLKFNLAHFNWVLTSSNCNAESGETIRFKAATTGKNYHLPLLVVQGLLVDTISGSTLSRQAVRAAQHAQFVQLPHIADEVAQLGGMSPDLFRRLNRRFAGQCFNEPPPIPGLVLDESPRHRYGDSHGLRLALAQCLARMKFHTPGAAHSIFNIPFDLLEREAEAQSHTDALALLASPTFTAQPLLTLKSLIDSCASLDLWGTRLHDLFARSSDPHSPPAPLLTVADSTPQLACLFKTCSGYVGAALCPLRPGDKIFLVPGCAMPVALRPSERVRKPGVFELLGGVFVPGIMDGEAWRGGGADTRSQMIVLV